MNSKEGQHDYLPTISLQHNDVSDCFTVTMKTVAYDYEKTVDKSTIICTDYY